MTQFVIHKRPLMRTCEWNQTNVPFRSASAAKILQSNGRANDGDRPLGILQF